MTYGLEKLILLEKDLKALDKSYIEMLRNMMALRNKTASAAVYLLMGSVPIRVEIHIQMLKLYGAITRMPQNSSLNKIAFRQLTIGHARKSSFIQIRRWQGYTTLKQRFSQLLHNLGERTNGKYSLLRQYGHTGSTILLTSPESNHLCNSLT